MNIGGFNEWLSAVALIGTIGNAAWTWLSRPARDTNRRLAETNRRVDGLTGVINTRVDEVVDDANARADRHREGLKEHDRRIQRIEDDLRHLPTKQDLHQLSLKMTTLETQTSGISHTVNRIDDYLRRNA